MLIFGHRLTIQELLVNDASQDFFIWLLLSMPFHQPPTVLGRHGNYLPSIANSSLPTIIENLNQQV